MYMSIIGNPNDQELETYPHVLLTSPHERDSTVLDHVHPNTLVVLPGHLIHWGEINMIPGLMRVVTSKAE